MQETALHNEAFEFYYGLGSKRRFPTVVQEYSVSRQTVQNWSRHFNWAERVHLRDIEVAKELKKRTLSSTVNIKAKRLKELSNIQNILNKAIKTAIKTIKENKEFAKNPADLNFLTLSKERITRLEQLLLGEDTAKETLEIRVGLEEGAESDNQGSESDN